MTEKKFDRTTASAFLDKSLITTIRFKIDGIVIPKGTRANVIDIVQMQKQVGLLVEIPSTQKQTFVDSQGELFAFFKLV